MDIYTRKSQWKWYLAAGGLAIVIISLLYTRYLAQRLVEREDEQAAQFAMAMRSLASLDLSDTCECDLTLALRIMEGNTTIPVIVLDERHEIEDYRNINGRGTDTLPIQEVRTALQRMVAEGADTIPFIIQPDINKLLIYSHSNLLTLLNWYPIIQLILIMAFIAFGYMGFSAARKAEENMVWLGMAKETAHQLGTPITAIMGWIEALRSVNEENAVNQEMLGELETDVHRLELVSERFSKIGAKPELFPTNIYAQLERNREYMQRRAPRRVTFDFPNPESEVPLTVRINAHLFDWVLENLLRNSIDSMEEGIGVISSTVYQEPGFVCIDISDTGKGIAPNRLKTVFRPGYSTKSPAPGLGRIARPEPRF